MAINSLPALRAWSREIREEALNMTRLATLIDRVDAFVAELSEQGVKTSVGLCGRDITLSIFQDAIDLEADDGLTDFLAPHGTPGEAAPAPQAYLPETQNHSVSEPDVVPPPQEAQTSAEGEVAHTDHVQGSKAKRKPDFTRVWTPAKEARLIEMKQAGAKPGVIAAELGVTPKAAAVRYSRLRAQGKVPCPAAPNTAALQTAAGKSPGALHQPGDASEAGGAAAPASDDQQALWSEYLDAVGNAAPWTVDLDLRLAGYIAKDMGIGGAAAMLKMKRDDVAARWTVLSSAPFAVKDTPIAEQLREALTLRRAEAVTS